MAFLWNGFCGKCFGLKSPVFSPLDPYWTPQQPLSSNRWAPWPDPKHQPLSSTTRHRQQPLSSNHLAPWPDPKHQPLRSTTSHRHRQQPLSSMTRPRARKEHSPRKAETAPENILKHSLVNGTCENETNLYRVRGSLMFVGLTLITGLC